MGSVALGVRAPTVGSQRAPSVLSPVGEVGTVEMEVTVEEEGVAVEASRRAFTSQVRPQASQ